MTESLTRAQYRTLRRAFSDLPDETVLYPTHGGGSFCSTGAGGERTSTLGRERAENPLLSLTDEDEFARWFPTTFPAVPDYFFRLREVNRRGPRLRREIPPPRALDPEEFAERRASAVVIDARGMVDYAEGHIPGSLNNTLRDVYAVWLGWLVPEDTELLFVVDSETDIESLVEESMLVGYERFGGWLHGGVAAWQSSGRKLATTDIVGAREARDRLAEGAAALDVREPNEFALGHIEGALNVPLGSLGEELTRIPHDRPLVVNCGHGERASTAISMLEAAGWRDLINLNGGIGAWASSGYAVAR
jgi:rhodanese-related sulfurtransferase